MKVIKFKNSDQLTFYKNLFKAEQIKFKPINEETICISNKQVNNIIGVLKMENVLRHKKHVLSEDLLEVNILHLYY